MSQPQSHASRKDDKTKQAIIACFLSEKIETEISKEVRGDWKQTKKKTNTNDEDRKLQNPITIEWYIQRSKGCDYKITKILEKSN